MHATILLQMFHLVQTNKVSVPLFDPGSFPLGTTNQSFLCHHVVGLLSKSFPNLSSSAAAKFVDGVFGRHMPLHEFKTLLRDFLITLKEFSAEDNTALYFEEKELIAREQEQQKTAVPGMLQPSDIVDDDL